MRVGTYNVLGLSGYPPETAADNLVDEKTRSEHFTSVFSSLDCQILLLEEGVDTRLIHPIARNMQMNCATIPSPVAWPGHILTTYQIEESRVFSHFSPDAERRPLSRCAGAARLRLEDGHPLWVCVLHLHPHASHSDMRQEEAAILRNRIKGLLMETEDAVVAGDFNCTIDEPLHIYLMELGFVNAMDAVLGGIRPTVDTVGKGPSYIDHIYVRGRLATGLRRAMVVRDPGFRRDTDDSGGWDHSDHLPVLVDIDITSHSG